MTKATSKLNPAWTSQTRNYFLDFLKFTKFPHPERNGSHIEFPTVILPN